MNPVCWTSKLVSLTFIISTIQYVEVHFGYSPENSFEPEFRIAFLWRTCLENVDRTIVQVLLTS